VLILIKLCAPGGCGFNTDTCQRRPPLLGQLQLMHLYSTFLFPPVCLRLLHMPAVAPTLLSSGQSQFTRCAGYQGWQCMLFSSRGHAWQQVKSSVTWDAGAHIPCCLLTSPHSCALCRTLPGCCTAQKLRCKSPLCSLPATPLCLLLEAAALPLSSCPDQVWHLYAA